MSNIVTNMTDPSSKQYGLIDPKLNKPIPRPAIFNSDSDSDLEKDKPTGITTLKKKERLAQAKAVAEDPTIYQYDELYDDIQNKRKESKLARKDLDKKPKYINKLLESAERRKRENERRIERQVQKEREEEGDMFKDKESFVTTAYRKKLEELKELEEKEKREDYLESIGDVRKQGDLSGFYRHLYAQKVNYEEEDKKQEKLKSLEQKTTKKRKYRKREASKSDDNNSDTNEKPNLSHLPSNIDADSDFSIDSDSSDDSNSENKKTEQPKSPVVEVTTEESPKNVESNDNVIENKDDSVENKENEDIEQPKKPKIDIWKKRTVGEAFDEALRKFYERKAAKVQSV